MDLIPSEVGCIVLESDEPSIVGQGPLFLRAEEIIHSKQDILQFRVFINLLEVHDFSLAEEGSSSNDDDFWFNLNRSCTISPWSRIHPFAIGASSAGKPLPGLPSGGGGACWSHRSEVSMVVQEAPQRCPSCVCLARAVHHDEAEVQVVVHANDSHRQAKSMRFEDPRAVTSATFQARAKTQDVHIANVSLPPFRESLLDMLE
jgi:hypothetical protein